MTNPATCFPFGISIGAQGEKGSRLSEGLKDGQIQEERLNDDYSWKEIAIRVR